MRTNTWVEADQDVEETEQVLIKLAAQAQQK